MPSPFSALHPAATTVAEELAAEIIRAPGDNYDPDQGEYPDRPVDRWLKIKPSAPVMQIKAASAPGAGTAEAVVTDWKADPEIWSPLMDEQSSIFGATYRYYSGRFTSGHLWVGVVLAVTDPPSRNSEFFASHAGRWLLNFLAISIDQGAANALISDGEFGGSWRGEWEPQKIYGIGETVISPINELGGSILATNIGVYGSSGEDEPTWPMSGAMVPDNDLVWKVIANLPNGLSMEIHQFYLSAATVYSDLVAAWSFLTPVSADLTAEWSFLTPVSTYLFSVWSFLTPVSADLTAEWSFLTPVSTDLVSAWSFLTPVSADLTAEWDVDV